MVGPTDTNRPTTLALRRGLLVAGFVLALAGCRADDEGETEQVQVLGSDESFVAIFNDMTDGQPRGSLDGSVSLELEVAAVPKPADTDRSSSSRPPAAGGQVTRDVPNPGRDLPAGAIEPDEVAALVIEADVPVRAAALKRGQRVGPTPRVGIPVLEVVADDEIAEGDESAEQRGTRAPSGRD